jgi:hypothetical protein
VGTLYKRAVSLARKKWDPNSDLEVVIAREPNLAFYDEIATHLAGARMTLWEKAFGF